MTDATKIPFGSLKVEQAEFNRRLRRMIRESPQAASVIVRRAASQVIKKTMEGNPVLTGRSRAGWFAAAEVLHVPIPRGPDAKAVAEGRTKGRVIDRLKERFPKITIINAIEYILGLEFGRSMQAPAGMLRKALQEIQGTLNPEYKKALKAKWERTKRR